MDTIDTKEDGGRGRRAETPAEIPPRGWGDILWRTYESLTEDRILLVAAGVTFYALLALVPAIAAFLALYGLFFDPHKIRTQINQLTGLIPDGAVEIIRDQATRIAGQGGGTLGATFLLSLVVSLWSANSGVKSVFDALNVAYDEEEKRSFLLLTAESLLFTIAAICFVIIALGALAVVPLAMAYLDKTVATQVVRVGRWPVLLAVIVFALAALYRFGPSREKAQWRWITWGSAIAAVVWLAFSMLFSWYVANFGSYNKTYGSLGAVVGFMTWIWLSVTIVLMGAELNAEIEHQTAKDTTEGGAKPIGQRGAEMADTVGKPRS